MATPKQISYIESLLHTRELSDEVRARGLSRCASGDFDFDTADRTIKYLLKLPKTEFAATRIPDVPAGRYAVTRDGVLRFYRIDRPTEGRWAGRMFVNVQHSDDFSPIRNPEERKAILRAISRDTEAALRAYGHELGVCGVCGRTLTDEVSRANGIGPICAQKYGYSFADTSAHAAPAVEDEALKVGKAINENVKANGGWDAKDLPRTFDDLKRAV